MAQRWSFAGTLTGLSAHMNVWQKNSIEVKDLSCYASHMNYLPWKIYAARPKHQQLPSPNTSPRDAVKLKGLYGQDYERVTVLFCLATSVSKILIAQENDSIHFDLIIASTLQRHYPSWLIRHIKDIAPSKLLIITNTQEHVDFRIL